ncbi:MAG: glutamate--tRNA ligase, partial [Lachnospiraceae bacterium]|nr:glutamate--tRNA ligase [Lachnospiraceae bacterium]
KAMDPDRFFETSEGWLRKAITKDLDLRTISEMVRTRIEVWQDIPEMVSFFEALPDYDTSLYVHKKMKTSPESALQVLTEVLPVLEAQEDYSNDALFASLKQFITDKGYKNGYVLWPLRIAVSGRQVTPAGATEIMEILGKEETLARIRDGIARLGKEQH